MTKSTKELAGFALVTVFASVILSIIAAANTGTDTDIAVIKTDISYIKIDIKEIKDYIKTHK